MATDQERELAEKAQDAARRQYAEAAKTSIQSGRDATYTAQPGDTLESIAEAVYGDREAAAAIYDASVSSGAIGTDRGAELAGGTVLTLPVVAGVDQPDQAQSNDVAADIAGDRPVGDRASTTAANPNAREGGVGGPTSSSTSSDEDPGAERARLEARLAELNQDAPADQAPAPTGQSSDDQAAPA
jgi:phage tail protein X